ncbi:Calx-beta domain-containing protein [Falsiroseomonas selenitidurans]|uniref:Calx-beta domain-containing protein n=1 Tax=Falsiroseomonas selenitidurans TaxID=2716335 RepID=A0ABX1EA52_9PROT|nr:hypothetical protein [Falsiroseomonas selenitidurans]NKC33705.1 hypothetical protein [Falsiroseomonas selenitidurans]
MSGSITPASITPSRVVDEFLVNSQLAGNQAHPRVTKLQNGNFVATWSDYAGPASGSSGSNVKAQLFDGSGTKIGAEFTVNSYPGTYAWFPSVTALVGGGFVVTWEDRSRALGDNNASGIHVQIFDSAASRVGSEIRANTQTNSWQLFPSVSALLDGGFVIAWADAVGTPIDAVNAGVKAQIFSALGTKINSEFLVNALPTGMHQDNLMPTVATLKNGDFVITWTDANSISGDASGTSIKAQRFDASGSKVGADFLVNSQTSGNQSFSTITALQSGGFVVTWTDASGTLGDANGTSIKAQLFDAGGNKVGSEFLVNSEINGNQSSPAVFALQTGGFVVTWTDASGTLGDASGTSAKGQLFDANGGKVGAEFLVNSQVTNNQSNPTGTQLSPSTFLVSWNDTSGTLGDADGFSIKAAAFSIPGSASISIAATSASKAEGNTGTTPFTFTVSRTGDTSVAHTVTWTVSGTGADAANAYDAETQLAIGNGFTFTPVMPFGDISFAAGETAKTITVNVLGDTSVEADEGFTVTLSNPSVGLSIGTAAASGTIINDDLVTIHEGAPLSGAISGSAGDDIYRGSPVNTPGIAINALQVIDLAGNATVYADSGQEEFAHNGAISGSDFLFGDGNIEFYVDIYGIFNPQGFSGTALTSGAGETSIYINNYSDGGNALQASSFDLGGGDDFVAIKMLSSAEQSASYGLRASSIKFGTGNDTLIIENSSPSPLDGFAIEGFVEMGDGDDAVEINSPVGIFMDNSYLDAGGGADSIVLRASVIGVDRASVRMGDGNDILQVIITKPSGLSMSNALVDLGRGDDVLMLDRGSGTIDGGEGLDIFTLKGVFSNFVIVKSAAGVVITHKSDAFTNYRIINIETLRFDDAEINLGSLATEGADTLTGTPNADTLDGLGGNDSLIGLAGDDLLVGGTGADTMLGGTGNDTYVVDNTGDRVIEASNAGMDHVLSSVSFNLSGQHIENLTLTGTSAINGTGNTLANQITGNSGNNLLMGGSGNDTLDGGAGADTLDGGTGADSMVGGTGNDTYVVDNTGDRVIEASNAGVDHVRASVTFSLSGQHIENLTLTGTSAINGTGNTLANQITGNSGNNLLMGGSGNDTLDGGAGADTLDGGTGADSMVGGTGNDTYVVDNTGDRVIEASNAGVDHVRASVTFSLSGQHIENLTLTGTSAINGTGNTLANQITGNSGNNLLMGGSGNDTLDGGAGADTLDGGTGADSMVGGTGNDTYVVDNTGDRVIEASNAGVDHVRASVTFSLSGQHIENLTLTGTSAINGTGNTLANQITGNSANNLLMGGSGNDTLDGGAGADTLDGGTGADSMVGGTGNDTYVVDNTGDRVIEASNAGVDHVLSSVSFNLSGQHIENLTLTGTAAINGTGNTLANQITGNSANNRLDGGAGNDTLMGGGGRDVLTGGTGADVFRYDAITDSLFVFNRYDVIMDFSSAQGDRIDLSRMDVNATPTGRQAFVFIGSTEFSTVNATGQLAFGYDPDLNVGVLAGSTDADSDAEFVIMLRGVSSLSASDLILG